MALPGTSPAPGPTIHLPPAKPPNAPPPGEIRCLDPSRIRFFRHGALLRLTIEDEVSYLRVSVVRAFPHSMPHRYFSVLDAAEKEIGLLVEPDALDATSREVVEQELARRYRFPVIEQVYDVKDRFGTQDWVVETDLGTCRFTTRDLFDNARLATDGTLILTDVDGNRYAIPSMHGLDPQSRRLLDMHV